ncbi:DUF5667 domain-containing protein [Chloroflexota bacterium]
MKRIEEILIQCIEDIKAGKTSLADCLGRYPDVRRELEPLLRIALSIKEPTDISPSDAFKIRARVNLMEHIHASQSGKRAPRSLSQAGVRQVWYAGWARAVAIVVAVILFISALGTGTAYASQSSLPGDTLYPVKLGTEQLQRVITLDDAAEVELELKFASTRLKEMEEVVEKNPEEIPVAVTGYERNLNLAILRAEQTKNEGLQTNLQERIALVISSQLSMIDELEDGVPEEAEKAISNAKDVAINGHIKALQGLAKKNPVKAAEINMKTMQGRLNRAEVESERGNVREMERTLQHFQSLRRFGEEISEDTRQRGYDTRAIDEINARATAGQMQILGDIYGNATEETKGAVEEAMESSAEGHEQAVKGLRQQGSLDDIPEEPPLPDEIPDNIKGKILNPEPDRPINGSGEPGNGSGDSGGGKH